MSKARVLSRTPGLLLLLFVAARCAHEMRNTVAPEARPAVTQLWVSPADLPQRNLFYGPGGRAQMPAARNFAFLKKDITGASPGYDVRDRNGREWSVKLGIEAQPEIVTSRLLWAIGFHQPAIYYVPEWNLTGEEPGPKPAGRFRLDPDDRKVVGEWNWFENPFVGTRPLGGLIAANLLLNNWDFKTSNNKVYELQRAVRGDRRLYVVRDLGASLGKTSQPGILSATGFVRALQGSKGNIEDFEEQGYVRLDEAGRLDFDYKAVDKDLVGNVTPADVVWACGLFSRLSDRQLADAFRAAGYPADVTARYVKKLRQKIAEGLAVARPPRAPFDQR